MTFEEWFKSTWEILCCDPAGRMVFRQAEFEEYLEEAFEAGKESK